MARVAIRARDFVDVMVVAVPAESRIRSMAIHTLTVLGVDWRRGVLAEYGARGGALFATPYPSGMIAGWSMAGFALQLAVSERPVRISRVCMCTLEQDKDRIIFVTRKASVRALATVVGFLTDSGAGGQDT